MLNWFHAGGPLMYPILLCSVLALGIFLDRFYTYFQVRRRTERLAREVAELVAGGRTEEALAVCRQAGDNPLGRIYVAALRAKGKPRAQIKDVVDEVGRREAAPLERY